MANFWELPYGEPQFCNLNFERALIGNLLRCAAVGKQPAPGFDRVPPENYFLSEHRLIVRAIQSILRKGLPPTEVLLFDLLNKHYPDRSRELIAYISELADWSPTVSPNGFYAEQINRYAALRKHEKPKGLKLP